MIERFIALHMMYERIAPLEPTSAPVVIRRLLFEREARRRRRPAGIGIQHRNDDRHIRAADRKHEQKTERKRDRRHRRGSTRYLACITKSAAQPNITRPKSALSEVLAFENERIRAQDRLQLSERDQRAGERDGADEACRPRVPISTTWSISRARRLMIEDRSRTRRAPPRVPRSCAAIATSCGIAVI